MRAFNVKEDLKQINGWLEARGMPLLCDHSIPNIGMIEDNIACGFVVVTDVGVCFLEGFITNKEADSQHRHMALEKITRWAINWATACGFSKLLVMTSDDSIIGRATEKGFEVKQAVLMTKKLGDNHGVSIRQPNK